MTPGSSVGFGLGDRPVAVGCRGHSKAMTGLPGEAAAQHVAAGDARVPGAGSITDALTDPRPPAAVGSLSERTPVTPIVEARGLTKRFGRTQALAGLDLVAQAGRVVALLGPNGAGKTTFVRSVATLLRPDAGSLQVAGIDALRHPARVRQVIGLAGQFAAVEPAMTGRENLEMVASLVGAPRLLLLDEPTAGLDPGSRVRLRDAIRQLVAAGTDVLLTTQYLDEADQLAADIVIIDHGQVIAAGTPSELKTLAGDDVIEVHVRDAEALPDVAAVLSTVGRDPRVDRATRRVWVAVDDGTRRLMEAMRALDHGGAGVEDISLRRPTLDEVFLTLTGKPAGTAGQPSGPEAA